AAPWCPPIVWDGSLCPQVGLRSRVPRDPLPDTPPEPRPARMVAAVPSRRLIPGAHCRDGPRVRAAERRAGAAAARDRATGAPAAAVGPERLVVGARARPGGRLCDRARGRAFA